MATLITHPAQCFPYHKSILWMKDWQRLSPSSITGVRILFSFLFFLFVPPPSLAGDPGWHIQVDHYPDVLWHISAVSRNVCWVLGVHGTILRTTDGGNTWAPVQDARIASRSVTALAAFGSDVAIIAISTYDTWSTRSFSPGDTSWILRTSDGGSSWHETYCLPGGFLNGIHRLGQTGAVSLGNPVADRWTILLSSNAGITWLPVADPLMRTGSETGSLGSSAARGERYVWFGALDSSSSEATSRIYRSTDGGNHWTHSILPFPNPHTLDFRDSLVGVVSTAKRQIARTMEGGASWSIVTLPRDEASGDVAASPDGQLWLTQYRSVLSSTDAGQTWSRHWQAHPTHKVVMKFDLVMEGDSLFGWATTWAGGIARFEGKAVKCTR
jgi:photosystem II stability/assembly factor-like uncharacterized protein